MIFLRIMKNRGLFYEFCAKIPRFFMNTHFILLLILLVFSVEIVLALASTRGHAHDIPFEVSTLIGQFLNS